MWIGVIVNITGSWPVDNGANPLSAHVIGYLYKKRP